MAALAYRAMVPRALWTAAAFLWLTLVPYMALADRKAVQDIPCKSGAEPQLAVDGGVSGCRVAVAASLLVDPAGGNDQIACAAESAVEFHRNGYLAFCGAAATAATYRGRAGRETRCRAGATLALGEAGYLDYCS